MTIGGEDMVCSSAATPLTAPAKPARRHRRRLEIADAAIRILAGEGARALSHRSIDRGAQLPEGTTSNFYGKRRDILIAACERVVALDERGVRLAGA